MDPVQTSRPAPVGPQPIAGEGLAGVRRLGSLDDPAVPPAEAAVWSGPRLGATPVGGPAEPAQAEATAGVTGAAARPTPDPRTLALLSRDVYLDAAAPPAGWSVAGQADLDRLGLTPDMLDGRESDFLARVYVEGQGANARYVVAFRGSQSREDWISNGQQLVGAESAHYRMAQELGERLTRPTGVSITLTGHSLGGGLASTAAIASGRDATTFNAAGLHPNTISDAAEIRSAAGIAAAPEVRAYHVRGEILSAMQDGGDQLVGAFLGRAFGGWLGGPAGGTAGGMAGRYYVDAPEAYGTRIPLDAVAPPGTRWYQTHPLARHEMPWVLSSLPGG